MHLAIFHENILLQARVSFLKSSHFSNCLERYFNLFNAQHMYTCDFFQKKNVYGCFSLIWVWNGPSTEFMHLFQSKMRPGGVFLTNIDAQILYWDLGQNFYVFVAYKWLKMHKAYSVLHFTCSKFRKYHLKCPP